MFPVTPGRMFLTKRRRKRWRERERIIYIHIKSVCLVPELKLRQ
jgi:hypothetical protein